MSIGWLFLFVFLKKIKKKVTEGVKEITRNGAKFVNGAEEEFDAIILATGYKSNVPTWLKVTLNSYYPNGDHSLTTGHMCFFRVWSLIIIHVASQTATRKVPRVHSCNGGGLGRTWNRTGSILGTDIVTLSCRVVISSLKRGCQEENFPMAGRGKVVFIR